MTAWCRVSRSKSLSGPPSLIATSHASGIRSDRPSPEPPPSADDRQRQRSFGLVTDGRQERPRLAPACSIAQLGGQGGDRSRLDCTPERPLHERLSARVKHEHGRADQRRERGGQRLEAALGQHDPLEPLMRRDRAAQDRVLLVDELRERRLGDRDERHLVGNLEYRKVPFGRRLQQRRRNLLVAEPDPEPEPGQLVVSEPGHELALLLGAVEQHPGAEQQLAAGQPRRRILQLGDVDPPHR